MDLKKYSLTLTRKAATGLVFALMIALLSVSFAFAALHAIDTTNDSIEDWASVPVFQTDSSGDVNPSCSGGDGTDDIIETYVATGPSDPPTHIYFRVRTASASAISTSTHQVAAYIDCGPGGAAPDGPDQNDVVIAYRGAEDHVIFGDGAWGLGGEEIPTPLYLYLDTYSEGGLEGERPSNGQDTVEWGMPFADFSVIASNPEYDPEYVPNCGPGSEARISFFTYKVTFFGSYDCSYDQTDFAGFDIPTVVELNSLSAQSTSGGDRLAISAAALLGAAVLGGLGLLLVHRRNQSA